MTQNIDCNKLDAYLADDLSVDDALRFESHVEECGACHQAVDEQHWVDSLLESPLRTQLERTPATLLVRSSLSRRRRHLWPSACGLAAAAVLVIAIGWLDLDRQAKLPPVSQPQELAVAEAVQKATRVESQATFVATTDAIAVPLESPSADVTIVQVYPTTDTERRWRLEAALSTNL